VTVGTTPIDGPLTSRLRTPREMMSPQAGMAMTTLQGIPPLIFLIVATTLEVSGDAVIRKGLFNHSGLARIGLFVIGTTLLFGYGACVNLAPLEFGQVVGLYIATLFVVWQIINFIAFRSVPSLPIVIGGLLIVIGGSIVTFWRR